MSGIESFVIMRMAWHFGCTYVCHGCNVCSFGNVVCMLCSSCAFVMSCCVMLCKCCTCASYAGYTYGFMYVMHCTVVYFVCTVWYVLVQFLGVGWDGTHARMHV